MTRMTKYLPRVKGLSFLLSCYQRFFPNGAQYRIPDFDGNLILDVNLCETIGINLWHAPQAYERHERKLFCSALKPGCTVLDVGANIGIYTLLAAKRGAKVFSIEADPANADALKRHISLNHLGERVNIYQIAAANKKGIVHLHRNPFNIGGSSLYGDGEGICIEAGTIDSLDLAPIDLCKMDIEGAELLALEGMTETLRRSPNMKLLVECSKNGKNLVRLLQKHFRHVQEVAGPQLSEPKNLSYCNLWAWN
ncbi:MAG TPA: FkbM family methyltransferase [Terriglobales bacterium]|nr:FkbM family methyltransferase [Terriglobales bacterium]